MRQAGTPVPPAIWPALLVACSVKQKPARKRACRQDWRRYSLRQGGHMLELRGVSKRFLGIPAVDGVSFSARAGEITGYLGPNGSGKSTTMKMITGLIEPTSGEILFRGDPIARDWIAYKQALGYVPEEPHQIGRASCRERV